MTAQFRGVAGAWRQVRLANQVTFKVYKDQFRPFFNLVLDQFMAERQAEAHRTARTPAWQQKAAQDPAQQRVNHFFAAQPQQPL